MPVIFEKARVNIWNILGFIISIGFAAFGWGVTYANMNSSISAVAKDVEKIQNKMPDVAALQFQMTSVTTLAVENKKANEETNKRIDRVVDSINGKLDVIVNKVTDLSIDVAVKNKRQ